VFDGDFGIAGFDMDVGGATLECGENEGFHETDDRAGGSVAGEAITGDGLFALFVLFGDLESEGLGGLLENALRLFGALEQVADLTGSGNTNGELFSEKQRQFVAEKNLTGVCDSDGQGVALRFEGNKVVAEHQVRRNAAEEFGIDALLAEVDKA